MSASRTINGATISKDDNGNSLHEDPAHTMALQLKRMEEEEAVIASMTASAHEARNAATASLDKKRTKPNNRTKKSGGNSISSSDRKKNKQGRKGDPRMHRAVAARLADSSISLLEALRRGGFNYPPFDEDAAQSMYAVEDSDGVQLGQRKNQLSRRLRLLRKEQQGGCSDIDASCLKLKEDEVESSSNFQESDDESERESVMKYNAVKVDSKALEDVGDGTGVVQVPIVTTSGGKLPTLAVEPTKEKFQNGGQQTNSSAHSYSSTSSASKTPKPNATEIRKESFQQQLAMTNLRTNNINPPSTESRGLLVALQQHRQYQLVTAASRSNIMMQSHIGTLLHHPSTNSLGNYINNLHYNQMAAVKRNVLDGSLASDMASVLSPDSSKASSRDSRGSKTNSEASSFFQACKKIEGRDLHSVSTFATFRSKEDKTKASPGNLPPPLFKNLSTASDLSFSTPPPTIPKVKPISDDDDAIQAEDNGRIKRFKEFFKMQRSFAKELFEFAGESQDEQKLRTALDFYRVDSASLIKSSMIKAGFGPETVNECDKNYLAFVARKLDYEVRRVERLVEITPQQQGRKHSLASKDSNVLNKRARLDNGHSADTQQKMDSTCSEAKVSEIIYNLKHSNPDRDDISSLGHTLDRDISSLKDEDFLPVRVTSSNPNYSPSPTASSSGINSSGFFASTPTPVPSSTLEAKANSDSTSNQEDDQSPTLTKQELEQAVLLHESHYSKIFTASASGTKVALKVLNMDQPSSKDVEGLFNEYAMTRSVPHTFVRKAYDRVLFKTKHALVLEWVDGKTVKEFGKCSIPVFLHIARQMAAGVTDIHQSRLMHMNLTYTNVMICNTEKAVRIIDFRHATRFYVKNPFVHYSDDQYRADFLPFMSPERTGRTNFKIDARSDLYSLGIIYYFLLTGKLPFEAKSPSQWMAMHVTMPIKPLKLLNGLIPGPVSDLVSMLTNKNPDDRYRSAESLLHDLDVMLLENQLYGSLISVNVPSKNFSRHLIIPQKLYGKEEPMKSLMSSWKRVRSNRAPAEIILINGSSGVGKSTLLSEFRNSLTKQPITVTFNFFSPHEPFASFRSALRRWMNNLVTAKDKLIRKIGQALKKEIGRSGLFLLSKVFGSIPGLFGEETSSTVQTDEIEVALDTDVESRLYYLIQKLFRCLSSANYPLILILESIHLADSHTLNLFSALVTKQSFHHCLLIFTCEPNKVSENESCIIFLQNVSTNNKIPINKIEINNLSESEMDTFCIDVFYRTGDEVKALSNFIHLHTAGNFRFTVQLIMYLSDLRLIRFSTDTKIWEWDMEYISKASLPSNVEDSYRQKFLQLDLSTQNLLKVAACIDKPFSLSMLDLVDVGTHAHVDTLLEDGIIAPLFPRRSKLFFSNHVIQRLAYSLISESERNDIQMKAGFSLLKSLSKTQLEDRLFSIGNHLDSGWDTDTKDQSEKNKAAKIFLRAGQKAQLVAAFPLAVQYITCAIQLIRPIYWKQEYELSLKLTNTLAEISFNIKDFDIMQESISQVTRQATTVVDRVPSLTLYMKSLYHQNKHEEALNTGMTTLQQLGENFPNIITETVVLPQLQKTKIDLLNELQNISSGVKKNENVTALATLCILSEMISLHAACRPALRTYIIIRFMQIIIKHGNSKYTPYGLAMFGSVLLAELEDIRDGNRFAKLAVSLIDDSKQEVLMPRVYSCYYISVAHWQEHVHSLLPPLLKSFQVSIESGCSVPIESSSTYILLNYGINCICSGKSLQELVFELSTRMKRLHRSYPMYETFLNILCCLVNKEESVINVPALLKNDSFWSTCEASASNHFESFFVNLLRMILCYYFREIEMSRTCIDKCQEFVDRIEPTYSYSAFFFYSGLISVSYSRLHPDEAIDIQMNALSKMKKWSINSSANYLNKLFLLEAEMAITENSSSQQEAVHLYAESISLARSNQFHHEEALACERMIELYIEWDNEQKARNYYRQAIEGYEICGFNAKVKELKERYSSIFCTDSNQK